MRIHGWCYYAETTGKSTGFGEKIERVMDRSGLLKKGKAFRYVLFDCRFKDRLAEGMIHAWFSAKVIYGLQAAVREVTLFSLQKSM